jgi:asparagine synthase (glutamine-hydrolysing)
MCGIIGGWCQNIEKGVESLVHRGPDAQKIISLDNLQLGHTRLSILDVNTRSDQPFKYGNTYIVFNGEIWNYKTLRSNLESLGLKFKTSGDTEVLAAALDTWGVDALSKLNGMFAIAWAKDGEKLYLARDRYGEIPLHIAKETPFSFSSELKGLKALNHHPKSYDDIIPGHYAIVTSKSIHQVPYYDISTLPIQISRKAAKRQLFELLESGVSERSISDVPICTLLSGGIDSALVAYFLKQIIPNLVAYTAVYNPKSKDLYSAKLVAEALDIELREIEIPLPSLNDLKEVIRVIEMPYKAQVEIGWPCLKLAEIIHKDGFKVTFSGEGSDELWASYGFAYHGLKKQGWHQYRKDLFLSQSRKNFARCNKIFMAHSIECRLPFLSPPLVNFAISLPQSVVQTGRNSKALLQQAFINKLPNYITKRPKVAFQDGLGIKTEIAKLINSPVRFYNAEYKSLYT